MATDKLTFADTQKYQAPVIIRFDIVDGQTGAVVGSAKTRSRARASVDRRDDQYGAYRFKAIPVYAEDAN